MRLSQHHFRKKNKLFPSLESLHLLAKGMMLFGIKKVIHWPKYPTYVGCDKHREKKDFVCNAELLTYPLAGLVPLGGGATRKAGTKAPQLVC